MKFELDVLKFTADVVTTSGAVCGEDSMGGTVCSRGDD